MDGQEELVLELENEALAQASHPEHTLALGGFQRRIGGAQDKRTREPDVFQRFAHDVRFQKIEIDGEVRNLGHAAAMIRQCPGLQAQLRSAYDWRAVRVVAEPRHSHESRALHSGSWTHG